MPSKIVPNETIPCSIHFRGPERPSSQLRSPSELRGLWRLIRYMSMSPYGVGRISLAASRSTYQAVGHSPSLPTSAAQCCTPSRRTAHETPLYMGLQPYERGRLLSGI